MRIEGALTDIYALLTKQEVLRQESFNFSESHGCATGERSPQQHAGYSLPNRSSGSAVCTPDPMPAAHGHGEQPKAPYTTVGMTPLAPNFQNPSQFAARTARRRALCVRCLPCSGRVRR
jgi:hypothetical protein